MQVEADMKCLRCGAETRVLSTMNVGPKVIRARECISCGQVEDSTELYTAELLRLSRVPTQVKVVPTKVEAGLTDVSEGLGDFRGSGSGSGSLLSLSDPDPSLNRKQGRGDAKEYPAEFETIWTGCTGRRGNKYPAFKAWLKFKPETTLTINRWALWMTTAQFRAGYVPHLSTWLNDKGWETEPTEAELRGSNGAANRAEKIMSGARDWKPRGAA